MGALIEKIKNLRNGSVMMAMNRPVKNSSTMTDSSPFCFSLSLSLLVFFVWVVELEENSMHGSKRLKRVEKIGSTCSEARGLRWWNGRSRLVGMF